MFIDYPLATVALLLCSPFLLARVVMPSLAHPPGSFTLRSIPRRISNLNYLKEIKPEENPLFHVSSPDNQNRTSINPAPCERSLSRVFALGRVFGLSPNLPMLPFRSVRRMSVRVWVNSQV
ncbi:hypothetical protein B0H13DRAFT_1858831 [Mycena leptocephala]|nr:hypothetical protein B0H13DRAFT_1858831 [Mycena leptocephala]